MRFTTKVAAVAATTVLAGSVVTMGPAHAAVITKPVTTGYAQLVLDPPLSTAFSATSPGRTAPNGMFFPLTAASSSAVMLAGNLRISDPSNGQSMDYPISLSIDKPHRTAGIVISLSGVSQTVFVITDLTTPGPLVSVNARKKTRTVSTTWTGDLRLTSDAATAANLNRIFGTSYQPGDKIGSFGLKVNVTAPCKNAKCTK